MTQTGDNGSEMAGRRDKRGLVALVLAGVVAGMVGLSFAAVPLYRLFCQQTGYGGTTQVATVAPDHILDRTIKVRFDTNVDKDLPWQFGSEQRVRLGYSQHRQGANAPEPRFRTAGHCWPVPTLRG